MRLNRESIALNRQCTHFAVKSKYLAVIGEKSSCPKNKI